MRKTIEFAKKLDVETIQVSLGHAFPGTEFYEHAKANGLVNIEGMADSGGHQLPNAVYPGFNQGELMEWVDRFYSEYYFRPKAAWRVVKNAILNNDMPRLYKEAREFLFVSSQRKKFVKEQKEAQRSAGRGGKRVLRCPGQPRRGVSRPAPRSRGVDLKIKLLTVFVVLTNVLGNFWRCPGA